MDYQAMALKLLDTAKVGIVGSKFKYNGITYPEKKFQNFLMLGEMALFLGVALSPAQAEELIESLRNETAARAEVREISEGTLPSEYSEDYNEENTLLFIADEEALENCKFIVESKTFRPLPKNAKSFLETLSKRKDKDTGNSPYEAYVENRLKGKITYLPYTDVTQSHFTFEEDMYDRKAMRLNIYVPPKFLFTLPKIAPEIPEIFYRYIEHLFPKEREQTIFLDKLHHIIASRCQTYIVLAGSRGSGKTTIGKILTKGLGDFNARNVPTKFLSSPFNAILKHNRLLIMDEVEATSQDKMDYLKEIINDVITIHAKFVNAREIITNHNSYILMNNYPERIAVHHDDRRFMFFSLTEEKLNTSFTDEEIRFLNNITENDPQLIQFMHALYLRKPIIDKDGFYVEKTKPFLDAVYANLAEWQKSLLEELVYLKTETILVEDFQRKITKGKTSKFMPSVKLIDKFLQDYRHGKKNLVIGKIVKETKADTVIYTIHRDCKEEKKKKES